MIALLVAGAVSLVFTLLLTPLFIRLFHRLGWGQFIRDDGPQSHHTKRGTATMGGIVLIIVFLTAIAVLPAILNAMPGSTTWGTVANWLRWPLIVIVLTVALAALYRFAPDKDDAKWHWISPGALIATAGLLIASILFSWYVSNFANYNETYGSLGAAIGLMMWMWMSAIIVLCGAELNSEIEHQTAVDTTVGPRKPLGSRGAMMADTVGAAQE